MNKSIFIYSSNRKLRLRSIEKKDNNLLREWKNKNKTSFFYQEEIDEKKQIEWFDSYLGRNYDYMFMVEENIDNFYHSFGCMGFRIFENNIDLYNIIRGDASIELTMQEAMHLMLSYIDKIDNKIITCDVLKDNPAVKWYEKCGFDFLKDVGYYVMKINKEKIRKIELIIDEEKAV